MKSVNMSKAYEVYVRENKNQKLVNKADKFDI